MKTNWKPIAVLSFCLVCTALLALYCRAEWLSTRRDLDRQRDLTAAALVSRDFWKGKHDSLQLRKPLTPRQQALVVKYEAAQKKK